MPTNYLDDDPEDALYPFGMDEDPAEGQKAANVGSPINAVNQSSVVPTGAPPQTTPGGPPPVNADALAKAQAEYARVLGERPTAPKPKWWQGLAAGGLGALTGIVNARGHMRHPIDATPAVQGIYGIPAYQRSLQDWAGRVQGAQAGVEGEQQKLSALEKIQQMTGAAELQKSEIEKNKANAGYYTDLNQTRKEMRAETNAEKNEESIMKRYGEDAWQQPAGQAVPAGYVAEPSPTQPDKMMIIHPPAMVPLTEDLAPFAKGRKVGEQVPYAEFKRAQKAAQDNTIRNENKPVKEVNVNAVQLAIRAAGGNPEDPASITPAIAKKASDILKPPKADTNIQLTPDALDYWSKFAAQTGTLPPLGMGASPIRSQILNRAPQVAEGDAAANKQEYGAQTKSLANLQKQYDQTMAFERTAGANLDIANQLSSQVGRTGSPLLNEWLLAAKGKIAGDENTRKFQAAVQTAANEYAKVVTNNGANGNVTDSARHEYERILNTADNPKTFASIIALMKREMNNRRVGYQDQLQEIRQRRPGTTGGGRGNPQQTPTPPGNTGGGMVKVISPEGVTGTIPADKLAAALQRGFKQVQ